jgi:hypothetical protein
VIDASDRHPGVQSLVRLLDSQHLPDDDLAKVSRLIEDTASQLLALLPRDGSRLTSALGLLWQAKNEAVGHAVLCRDEVSGKPATTLAIGETSTGGYVNREVTS